MRAAPRRWYASGHPLALRARSAPRCYAARCMANQDWVSRLLSGRASADKGLSVHLSERDGGGLHDKMRQAYWWITNNAVICPYYDIEFGSSASLKTPAGDEVHLPEDTSYSSFVLIPLLTLFT